MTQTQDYLDRFAAAARAHGMPVDELADRLAEIEQHVTDSGGDPIDEFGKPQEYARSLSRPMPRPPLSTYCGLGAGALLLVQGILATAGVDVPIGPTAVVALTGSGIAAFLVRRALRDQPAIAFAPLVTLVVFVALLVLGRPWTDLGVVLPPAVSLPAGGALAAVAGVLLVRFMPNGGRGNERTVRFSSLQLSQRALMTGALLTVTLLSLVTTWVLARG